MKQVLFLEVTLNADASGSVPVDLSRFVGKAPGFEREFSKCTVRVVTPEPPKVKLSRRERLVLEVVAAAARPPHRQEIPHLLAAYTEEPCGTPQVVYNMMSLLKFKGVLDNDTKTRTWFPTAAGRAYLDACAD